MPRVWSCRRSAWASEPLSVTMTVRRFRGRPRVPVRGWTASRKGTTGARSSPLAGVMQGANGIPAASVRRWMSIPFPVPPRATPSPPPVPGGTGAVHGPVLPLNHPVRFGKPEDPGWPLGQRAIGLPALPPPVGGALGRPWGAAREITPAAAGDQHVQQGLDHLAKGGMRHAAPTLRWCSGPHVRNEVPCSVAQTFESSGHSAFLPRSGAL